MRPSDVGRRGSALLRLHIAASGRMRKGSSDARVAASPRTAFYNMGLFVDLNEIQQPQMAQKTWRAGLEIALNLEHISLRHAAQRRAGLRTY